METGQKQYADKRTFAAVTSRPIAVNLPPHLLALAVLLERVRPVRSAMKAPQMNILRIGACIVASAAFVSACSKPAPAIGPSAGGPVAASAAATPRNPCALLTQADAEGAVGAALPQNSVTAALGMCGYTSADFTEGAQLTVGDWDSIKKAATSGAHQPTAVGGVGDEALYFTGQETGAGPLYVRHGQEGFLIVLNGPKIDHMPGADAMAAEKALARRILARF